MEKKKGRAGWMCVVVCQVLCYVEVHKGWVRGEKWCIC